MIIDDHFANPGNINVTMETIKFMNYNDFHLLYAIRGNRGPTVNEENARSIAEWMHRLERNELIATKSISHVTAKDKVSEEELDVFMKVMNEANIKVHLYDELPDAIAASLKQAEQGDLVLLAGCQGMDEGGHIALDILKGTVD